jgi:hypothetical protein
VQFQFPRGSICFRFRQVLVHSEDHPSAYKET